MNIYFRELKAHRKAIIIWSLVMILFVYMGMQKYSTLVGSDGDTDVMMKMINNMPAFLKALWGVSSLNIATPIGYFGIVFSYLALMGGIHACMLGSSIISKEERDKTVEFLMAKPVSRSKIITSKIMASLTNIVIFNIVTFITSIFVLKGLTDEPIAKQIILSMLAMFFLQLIFMIVGVGMAAIIKKPRKSGTITMAILLGTFFLSLIIDLSDKFEVLKFLTPFKYFDSKDFFVTGSLNIGYIILTLILITTILVMGYKKYNKRDLSL